MHALIILSLPSAAKRMEETLMRVPRVRASLNHVKESFSVIFRENSKRLRINFFSNKLVQHLWTHYIHAEENQIASYLSTIINAKGK